MGDLRALIEAVEAGMPIDYELAQEATGHAKTTTEAYHGSMDAALALRKELSPAFRVESIRQLSEDAWSVTIVKWHEEPWDMDFTEYGPDPTRALLLAILKAKQSESPCGNR